MSTLLSAVWKHTQSSLLSKSNLSWQGCQKEEPANWPVFLCLLFLSSGLISQYLKGIDYRVAAKTIAISQASWVNSSYKINPPSQVVVVSL